MLTELTIADQTIRYDREATASIYRSLRSTEAYCEACGCPVCLNFAAQRSLIYPEDFLRLLSRLGVDPDREGEVFDYDYEDAVEKTRPVLYGGWFYLIGQLLTPDVMPKYRPIPDSFQMEFTYLHPSAPEFGSGQVLAIDFVVPVKWILPEIPDLRLEDGS